MSDPAAVTRLAAEIDDLGRRLAHVSAELRTLQTDSQTAGQTHAPSPSTPPPRPPASTTGTEAFPPTVGPQPPQRARPRRSLTAALQQEGAGSRLLAWVGGAVTLLGVVLLLVLAIQRGWLGPLPRVVLGAGLGLGLIGCGGWLHRTPAGRTGALALAATGLAALYLDAIAITALYGYLPPTAGLALGLLVAVGGLWLAGRWRSTLLAIAVIVGCAVCAPIITGGFPPQLVAFLLTVQIAAAPLQLRHGWSVVAVVAGIPPVLTSVLATAWTGQPGSAANTAAALVAGAVGLALALLTARRRPDDPGALVLLAGSAAPALVAAWLLPVSRAVPVSAAVAVALLVVWTTRRWQPGSIGDVAGAAGLLATLQATLIQLDGTARAAVLLGEALLLVLVALRARNRVALLGSGAFAALGAVLGLASDLPPALLLLFQPRDAGALVGGCAVAVLMLAVAVALPWVALRLGVVQKHAVRAVLGALAGLIALYGAAGTVLCATLLVAPERTGFLTGHALITVSWTLTALALLMRGITAVTPRVLGLVLVAAAVLKLVLFDLAALDGMARVAAFLGAGLILLITGTRYARLISARRTDQVDSANAEPNEQ